MGRSIPGAQHAAVESHGLVGIRFRRKLNLKIIVLVINLCLTVTLTHHSGLTGHSWQRALPSTILAMQANFTKYSLALHHSDGHPRPSLCVPARFWDSWSRSCKIVSSPKLSALQTCGVAAPCDSPDTGRTHKRRLLTREMAGLRNMQGELTQRVTDSDDSVMKPDA